MASTVTIPLWLAVLVGVLAVVALIDRLFGPALGWWLRRRANRAIDELNQRLRLKIPPFKLARRRRLIEQLMFDPDILKAVEDEAKEKGEPKSVTHARARRYAKEIIPSFSAYTYFRVGTALARRLSTALYRVRLGAIDEASALPGARRCLGGVRHQSPLQHGLRAGHLPGLAELGAQLRGGRVGAGVGAAEPDPRHGRLFRAPRQLQRALPQGAGPLRAPGDRLGRRAGGVSRRRPDARRRAAPAQARTAQLHGVGLRPAGRPRYRVRAGRPQLRPRAGGSHPDGGGRHAEGRASALRLQPVVLAGFLLRSLWLRLRGRWHRYGYACVSFGNPMSLRGYLGERGVDLRALPADAALCRDRAARQSPDARGRARGAGAAGVAGGDRHPGRRRARPVQPRAQGRRVRADGSAAGPRARTCTSPARTRSTPSRSACACC